LRLSAADVGDDMACREARATREGRRSELDIVARFRSGATLAIC
jgi:hypothetical protein